jgi:hypothetical protein
MTQKAKGNFWQLQTLKVALLDLTSHIRILCSIRNGANISLLKFSNTDSILTSDSLLRDSTLDQGSFLMMGLLRTLSRSAEASSRSGSNLRLRAKVLWIRLSCKDLWKRKRRALLLNRHLKTRSHLKALTKTRAFLMNRLRRPLSHQCSNKIHSASELAWRK